MRADRAQQPFLSLADMLRHRAAAQSDHRVFLFLDDEARESAALTFSELDGRARDIAATLQAHAGAGERAILLYAPGLDFAAGFYGCVYAGAVAVPVCAPTAARTSGEAFAKLQAIIAETEPRFVLSATGIRAKLRDALQPLLNRYGTQWVDTDQIGRDRRGAWTPVHPSADDLAYLQYTSGSTSDPKGVMISHANALANMRCIHHATGTGEDMRLVSWLPFYHDMGLVSSVLLPVYEGALAVLMSPIQFLQSPIKWLRAITRYRGTHAGGPNFAFHLCAARITLEDRAALDLSSWRVAFNGAESVRHETLQRFTACFAPAGFKDDTFVPCYGLAESTLGVAWARLGAKPVVKAAGESLARVDVAVPRQRLLVSCGYGADGHEIAIVDPQTRRLSVPGQEGEIWVRGASVGRGYWNRPADSAQIFGAYLSAPAKGPYLRTGDLGFVSDGALYISGRLKDLLIIAGRNVHANDIEQTVEDCHTAIRRHCTAAFALEVDGHERLAVAAEVERSHVKPENYQEITDAVRRAIAGRHDLRPYMVALVRTGGIPKTSSGKVRRQLCRAQLLERTLPVICLSDIGRRPVHESVSTVNDTEITGDAKTRDVARGAVFEAT